MQITVHAESMRKAISKVLPVAENKDNRSILACALLEIGNNQLQLSATNLDISAQVLIKAESQGQKSFCINAKNLSDIVRELPDKPISFKIEEGENTLKIDCDNIHFTLPIHDNSNFPKLTFNEDDHSKRPFDLTSKQILEIIQMTSYAISNDETRLYLNGIYLQEIDSKVRAVATDGHRLSLVDFQIEDNKATELAGGIIIPKRGISELKRVAESNSEGLLSVSVSDAFLYVNSDDTYKIIIRLISREYPNYKDAIPTKVHHTMVADRDTLFNAIRRVKIMSHEKSNGVRVKLTPKTMTITARNPALGDGLESIPIQYEGKEMEIGLNAKYLIETLSTVSEGDISFELNNELSPIVVKSTQTPNYLGVIMPLKL